MVRSICLKLQKNNIEIELTVFEFESDIRIKLNYLEPEIESILDEKQTKVYGLNPA